MFNTKILALRALRRLGLEEPARSILRRLRLRNRRVHGHALLMTVISNSTNDLTGRVLLEVGSTREELPGQGSTAAFAEFCQRRGMTFITVDMDPDNTRQASSIVRRRNPSFKAVTALGEEYLASYNGRLDFVYLDAFDIDHGQHSEWRKSRYRELLDTDITNAASAEMHRQCAVSLVSSLSDDGIVVFDDTWRDAAGNWQGKGKTALPYLLDHGFEVVAIFDTSVAVRFSAARSDPAPEPRDCGSGP